MGFKPGQGTIRRVVPTAGMALLLMLALSIIAGQARATVPVGQSGSFPSSTLLSDPGLQPAGGPTHGTARIVINGTAPGSVTWSPPGLKNFRPEDCSGEIRTGDSLVECYFERGTVVTLTATPDSGYAFSRWDGACSGTSSTCKVTIDYTSSVAARFISSEDVRPPGNKGAKKKCKRAKKALKQAKIKLNKAKKRTRKAKKQAKKNAKARHKKAQKVVKRAKAKVKKAC